jgi:tetratricopeptide (TPR) repeat protein
MNRVVRALPNGLKTIVIGLALAALPYLAMIYWCAGSPRTEPPAYAPPISAAETAEPSPPNIAESSPPNMAEPSPPNMLPEPDSDEHLQTDQSHSEPIPAAELPVPQSEPVDSVPEPPLIASAQQGDNNQPAYIPAIGIIAENNFDEISPQASPPAWMPEEMPVAEHEAESSPSDATLSAEIHPEEILSPELKTPETLTNSAASAALVPAAQPTTVVDQSKSFATDSEQPNSSTESIPNAGAASPELQVRSEQLESIARQADQQIRHGFELAGRKAYYAARSEFIAALRLVAQGLDTDGHTTIHGKSLAAGLTALKEADDFIPHGAGLEADLDLADIIAGHTTSVLKDADQSSLTALAALKSYFNFAQKQLAQAAGREVAGSMALRALGKLYEEMNKTTCSGIKAAEPKAKVFYQASLLVFPENYMAANDLGVMLARNGKYEEACKMLEYGTSLSKQSTIWHNLAVVYGSLGRQELANQAQRQAAIARQTELARQKNLQISSGDQVRWVDENTFAQGSLNPTRRAKTSSPALFAPNRVMKQQTTTAAPKTMPTPGILQPLSNPYWAANANPAPAPAASSRTLPVLQPTTTVLLPKTQSENRR